MASLPVLEPSRKIRRSRAAKWRAAALIGIHVLIAAHIAHWLTTGRSVTPVEPSEAMAFARSGTINAGLIFFAATILLTAIFGRYFCGWACHLVALQDLSRWLLEKIGLRPVPLRSRLLRLVPPIAFVYMFLWPAAYRLWIGDSFSHFETELTTSDFWATFPGWPIAVLTFLTCGFVIVYFLGAKGFCTYACPYGAIFAAADRLAPLRIRVTDACEGCGHCTAVCTSNVRVHEEVRDFGMVVSSDCMKCRDCVSVCPQGALYYGAGPIPLLASPRVEQPARRRYPLAAWEEALLGVAFIAAFFVFRGLYGAIPFLMSLGLAGILAYLVLLAARLASRANLSRRGFRLKRAGRLLPAGYAFAGAMILLASLWGHSGIIRYHAWRGGLDFQHTSDLRRGALDVAAEPAVLDAVERARIDDALHHLERVRDWGFFPTAGNDRQLAWLYLLTGSTEDLRKHAQAAIARGNAPAEMYQLVGRDALRHGDLRLAAGAYEQAIAVAPRSAAPYVSLGIGLARAGELAAAESVFDRGRGQIPNSQELLYNAGLARALQGRSVEAIALLEQALTLDPEYLEARENLAGLLASVGRLEESILHYRWALEQAPEDAATRFLLARALAAAGDLESARTELRETLRLEPGQREAMQMLGDLANRGGAAPGTNR